MPVADPQRLSRLIRSFTASAACLALGCAASQPSASPAATSAATSAAPISLDPTDPSANALHEVSAEPVDPAVAALAAQVRQLSETLRQTPQPESVSPSIPPSIPEPPPLPLPSGQSPVVGANAALATTDQAGDSGSVVSEVPPLTPPSQPQAQSPVEAPEAVPTASVEGVEGDWPGSLPATPSPAESNAPPRVRDTVLSHLAADPASPAYAFDARLFELLTGESLPEAPTGALRPEDERILTLLSKQLAEFRDGLQAGTMRDPAERVKPILEMASSLRRETGLTLPTLALCSEVRVFGDYDPMPTRFPVGQAHPTVLYVEVDNFVTQQITDGGPWETKLLLSAILYGPDGHQVMSLPPFPVNDRSRQRRRDFFLAGRLTLPATVSPGEHMLKITVKDELGQRVAQESIKIEFTEAR